MLDLQTNLAWDTLLDLGDRARGPLYARLTRALREAIREGRLPSGSALPPSRLLAEQLECSRSVVTEAYEQLVAEGYLAARVGSGTRVRAAAGSIATRPPIELVSSADPVTIDLVPGLPDLRAFPLRSWLSALRTASAGLVTADLGHPGAAGHPQLRQVMADYLVRVRGARADMRDVTITAGITDGITRVCRALRHSGLTAVGVEDPGWRRFREAVGAAGLDAVPVPVDEQGLSVDELDRLPAVRAVIVGPNHQFPTGVALSIERRMAVLAWAHRVDGLVLEDDYDSEFRYDRRALGTLQGADPKRVALFGSVSKTLSPAIGIGWTLTPAEWTRPVRSVEARGFNPPVLDQLAFATFVQTGGYDRHLRRLRRCYRRRRDNLVQALIREIPDARISGIAAGLHLVVRLSGDVDYDTVAQLARSHGVGVGTMTAHRMRNTAFDQGLVLGYGNLDDDQVDDGVELLAAAIREATMPTLPKAAQN
jgi:GntR family transcriptional regulator/MocR family aminotransferase